MSFIEANIPIISEQQTWSRNQFKKNWGAYQVFKFKKGKPSLIFPNFLFIFYYACFQMLSIGTIVLDMTSPEPSYLSLLLRLLFLLLNLSSCYLLVSTDPGIASISDPVINQPELSKYRNYCSQCKCMQNERVKHCQKCQVCIEGSYVHLSISKMCVTDKNILPFCGICLSAMIQTILIL